MNNYSTETLKFIIELVNEYHNPSGTPKIPPFSNYFSTGDIVDFIQRVEFLGKPDIELIVQGLKKLVKENYLEQQQSPKGIGLDNWHITQEK